MDHTQILGDRMTDNVERPIAFVFRSLFAAEKNYSQSDKEVLPAFFSVKVLYLLYGHKFIIQTDHISLTQLLSKSKATYSTNGITATTAMVTNPQWI